MSEPARLLEHPAEPLELGRWARFKDRFLHAAAVQPAAGLVAVWVGLDLPSRGALAAGAFLLADYAASTWPGYWHLAKCLGPSSDPAED